jgi:ribosomal-protein-alanine N-acetyltransferase
VNFLALIPLTSEWLTEAVDLDQRCLGGLWSQDGYQREIDSPNSDLLMLRQVSAAEAAAEHQGNTGVSPSPSLIGLACAWAILDEAHITLLAVDSNYRRQGLGQLLLYRLLVLARHRGLEWATLEVRASNQAAISLYQQFGFESVGERPNYYQNPKENALILWRQGLQRSAFATCLQQWHQELTQRLEQTGWQLLEPEIQKVTDSCNSSVSS